MVDGPTNIERIQSLRARLHDWNALPKEERAALIRAGGGIVAGAEDFEALLEVVLGLVRRVN